MNKRNEPVSVEAINAGENIRSFDVDQRSVDEEKRTVELAFSSEAPYERWFGIEILDHDPASVDLSRLNGGAAVLVDHDIRDHVGVVESARIDGDRVGRAVVRFGRGARASEIFADIVDGIRRLTSVRYSISEYEVTKGEGDKPDVYRMTKWQPVEVSIVAIPADPSVGVGRSHETKPSTEGNSTMTDKDKSRQAGNEPANGAEKPDVDKIADEARTKGAADGAVAERKRIAEIMRLADKHDFDELGREHVDAGTSADEFGRILLDAIGKRNIERRGDNLGGESVGLDDKDRRRFSLVKVMRALSDPHNQAFQRDAAFEFEVHRAAAEAIGLEDKDIRGFVIPVDVTNPHGPRRSQGKRALTVGTATAGGNLVGDNLLAGSYIDALRNRLVVMNAGAMMLDGLVGNVEIPSLTAGSSAAWVTAEDADAANSDPTFGQVALSPKDVASYTEPSRRLLMQSTPSVEAILFDDLQKAAALKIDHGALYGSGSNGQPEGVANVTGINTFNFAAAAPTWAEVVRMVRETKTDNADIGALQYIIDPAGWEDAMTTDKASGAAQFILNEVANTIAGRPYQVSNQVTAEDWFYGNWNDLIIGQWGGLDIAVDPYTHSLKGRVRFVMFQTVDVGVRHAVSFCHCNDGV